MNENISNAQKYDNYKEQFVRLRRAMDNRFYLEALFIEYAIIEDRTKSILVHAGKYEAYLKKRGKYQETIDSKVKYIKGFAAEKKSLLNRYFGDALLDDILVWKEERNKMVHALLNQVLSTTDIEHLADTGSDYCKSLRNRVTNYKRALNRRKDKIQSHRR